MLVNAADRQIRDAVYLRQAVLSTSGLQRGARRDDVATRSYCPRDQIIERKSALRYIEISHRTQESIALLTTQEKGHSCEGLMERGFRTYQIILGFKCRDPGAQKIIFTDLLFLELLRIHFHQLLRSH